MYVWGVYYTFNNTKNLISMLSQGSKNGLFSRMMLIFIGYVHYYQMYMTCRNTG